jgi:protease IV
MASSAALPSCLPHRHPAGMSTPSPNRLGCFGLFVVVLLVVSLIFNVMFFVANVSDGGGRQFGETLIAEPAAQVKTKIAVIRLDGLIASAVPGYVGDSMVDDIKLQLKQAIEDNDVRAIVIAIDSPGGEVTASDIIYNAVKAANLKKKVVISMGALAASGGYYIACGGSHIVAHDTTFTGSIGVIMSSLNYSEAMGKVGLEMVTFKSGQFKDMLSGSRKLSPEEREYIQGMIMQTYDKFVGIVATERKLDIEALKKGVADGRVISGKDAFAHKLVDELGDLETAIAAAMKIGGAPGSAVVKYELPGGIARYLRLLGRAGQQPKKIEINVGAEHLPLKAGYQYLLPAIVVP